MLLFQVFYYYQGFLPLWITGAVLWWFVQLAYRRRYGWISGPALNRSMSLFSLSVLSSPLLGPIPFYLFLFYWLFRQPGREHPLLRRLNTGLATLLVSSAFLHTWLDWQRPEERRLSRVLNNRWLDSMKGRFACHQLEEWALYREGRLRSNAVYLLRYCPSNEAREALRTVASQGPPLADLARQSLQAVP